VRKGQRGKRQRSGPSWGVDILAARVTEPRANGARPDEFERGNPAQGMRQKHTGVAAEVIRVALGVPGWRNGLVGPDMASVRKGGHGHGANWWDAAGRGAGGYAKARRRRDEDGCEEGARMSKHAATTLCSRGGCSDADGGNTDDGGNTFLSGPCSRPHSR
jgi:hypothetical protein